MYKSKIPSQNNKKVAEYCYELGKSLTGNGCVGELGSWLGGSIEPVAKALAEAGKNTDIHLFDRFYVAKDRVGETEIIKAKKQGVHLKLGQDTLPIVQDYLNPINPNIKYHKVQDIRDSQWDNGVIELYMDDVCKSEKLFSYAIKTFSPYWIPGETVLVLMDFNYDVAQYQRKFIAKYSDHFTKVKEFKKYGSCAVFLYTKKLNNIKL